MKIRLFEKVFVSLTVWALLGVLFFGQKVFAEERFSTSLVKTIDGAFLWHLVNVGGTIYSGSYNYAESVNQVFYFATNPSLAASWSAYPVGNTLNHESTRVYNLNGNLYVTSEGIPIDEPTPVTGGAQIYANWSKIDDLDHQYSLAAVYFDNKYLIGWSPRTTDSTKLSTSDGTELYEASPGGVSKNLFLDVPEVMTFSAAVYNDVLYLHGCDTYSDYKADNSGLLVMVDKNKNHAIVNNLKHVGSQGALNVFDDKLFIATGKTVNLVSYNGRRYRTEKIFSGEWEVGEMEVFNDKLFVTVASQSGGDYKAEIWYRTKDSEGGAWSLAVSNSTFQSLGTAPGGAGGLVNASGWLAADSEALYATFVKGASQRNGMNGSNTSYVYRITENILMKPTCTLSFNPTEIDLGGKSTFSWTTTGEISKAWLSCNLTGSGEIGEILKTNPSGTVDWVANSTETEVCNLYLNSESATGNPTCSTSPGLRVKSDNNCQLDTCEGNSCWNGTSYVSGTKTEGCSTVTASFSSTSDSSGEIAYLNWSAKEAFALKFSCDGPVAITRTDFFLSSELWRSKAVIAGIINSTSNFRGFPVRFNVGAVGMEVCTFYPVNASDGKMGIPKSIIIQLGEGLNCECGRNVSLGEDVCAEGEICNGCHCVQTRDRRRTICKPDNPSCQRETCQDLYCFNGCRYIQGTKDCVGRR